MIATPGDRVPGDGDTYRGDDGDIIGNECLETPMRATMVMSEGKECPKTITRATKASKANGCSEIIMGVASQQVPKDTYGVGVQEQ
jgi:hypothetical protein